MGASVKDENVDLKRSCTCQDGVRMFECCNTSVKVCVVQENRQLRQTIRAVDYSMLFLKTKM